MPNEILSKRMVKLMPECEICGEEADKLTICKSCGCKFCEDCGSPIEKLCEFCSEEDECDGDLDLDDEDLDDDEEPENKEDE